MPIKNDSYFRHLKADEKDYKRSDSGGLFMLVTKTGSKLWRYAYSLTPSRSCSRSASIPSSRSPMPVPSATMPSDCWLTALILPLSARQNADKREWREAIHLRLLPKNSWTSSRRRVMRQPR
jgi:hypothetical protein